MDDGHLVLKAIIAHEIHSVKQAWHRSEVGFKRKRLLKKKSPRSSGFNTHYVRYSTTTMRPSNRLYVFQFQPYENTPSISLWVHA
eukprot:2788654-Pleurochrysis_carterae.AAC.2